MKFFYIGGSDVFSGHELGFVAALSGFGELDVVILGGEGRTRRLPIASDNGAHIVTFYEIPCNSLARVHLYTDTMMIKGKYSYNELFILSLLLAGLALIFIGFIGAHFSNSFSRQAAYPGYMLLFLGSFDALRRINHNKIGRVITVIIVVMAIFSGIFTIKNASWLYIGKVPYLTYRPPTTPDITLARGPTETRCLRRARDLQNIPGFRSWSIPCKVTRMGAYRTQQYLITCHGCSINKYFR